MIRVAEPLPRSHSVLLYILINSILQIMLLLLMCITVNLWHFASVWMLLMKYNVRSTWDRKTPGQCDKKSNAHILSFILIMLEVDTYLEHFQWTLTVQIKTNYRYMYFINLGIAKTTAYHKRWSWFVKHSLWQILNAFEVLYLADIFSENVWLIKCCWYTDPLNMRNCMLMNVILCIISGTLTSLHSLSL